MAVQLSALQWLVNNYFDRVLNDKFPQPKLSEEDKSKLIQLLKVRDEIHVPISPERIGSVQVSNVFLGNVVKLDEITTDDNATCRVLTGFYEIFKKYLVHPNFYIILGKAFEEFEMKPSKEIEEAFKFCNIRYGIHIIGRHTPEICWESEKKYKNKYGFYRR